MGNQEVLSEERKKPRCVTLSDDQIEEIKKLTNSKTLSGGIGVLLTRARNKKIDDLKNKPVNKEKYQQKLDKFAEIGLKKLKSSENNELD